MGTLADVAELADAQASGACAPRGVEVRLLSSAYISYIVSHPFGYAPLDAARDRQDPDNGIRGQARGHVRIAWVEFGFFQHLTHIREHFNIRRSTLNIRVIEGFGPLSGLQAGKTFNYLTENVCAGR